MDLAVNLVLQSAFAKTVILFSEGIVLALSLDILEGTASNNMSRFNIIISDLE